MNVKNVIIMGMGYFGILLIVLGIIVTPSQEELKDAELRTEYYAGGDFDKIEGDKMTSYGNALLDYDRLKRQEVVANHLVPIGLGMVLLTIPYAILRYSRQDFKIPQSTYQYPYPYPRVHKPEDFIVDVEKEPDERI
ncbi:hypothetical protein [[Eubacterium] cellulosolvens]